MRNRFAFAALVVALVVAVVPGVAAADDGGGEAPQKAFVSLGDSLAMGSLADATGNTIFPSNQSYTDRLYRKLADRVDGSLTHVKLGCDGEKTTDMITGAETKCAAAYRGGTQLGEAVAWLTDPEVDVVLVTIDIGANDINHLAGACGFDPDCIGAGVPGILGNLAYILGTLRGVGYNGPIVGMNYYNPNVAAAIGFYPGAPGPLAPDPGFAALSDVLSSQFNAGLEFVFGMFGAQTADVFSAFASGDFGDDGGRYQTAGNGVPDNVDAVCRLTYMCPEEAGVLANIHPTSKGYKVIALAFWKIVHTIDFDA